MKGEFPSILIWFRPPCVLTTNLEAQNHARTGKIVLELTENQNSAVLIADKMGIMKEMPVKIQNIPLLQLHMLQTTNHMNQTDQIIPIPNLRLVLSTKLLITNKAHLAIWTSSIIKGFVLCTFVRSPNQVWYVSVPWRVCISAIELGVFSVVVNLFSERCHVIFENRFTGDSKIENQKYSILERPTAKIDEHRLLFYSMLLDPQITGKTSVCGNKTILV